MAQVREPSVNRAFLVESACGFQYIGTQSLQGRVGEKGTRRKHDRHDRDRHGLLQQCEGTGNGCGNEVGMKQTSAH